MLDIDVVYIIAVGALLLVILMSGAGFVLIFRESRLRGQGPPHVQTDLTNMMILFQTMRDVLSEQKDLARTFNANVDTKMTEVKTLLEEARKEREGMQAAQHALMAAIDAVGGRVSELEHHAFGQDGQDPTATLEPTEAEAPAQDPTALEPRVDTALPDFVTQPDAEIPTPTLGIAAADWETAPPDTDPAVPEDATLIEEPVKLGDEPADEEPMHTLNDAAADTWTGLDFGGGESSPLSSLLEHPPLEAPQVPEELPETPQDAEAAREAFRALLDLGNTAPAVAATPASAEAETASSDNGKTQSVRIRGRVYEYSDAGMSVSDIARELGVGKGEVRLMLSLRKDEQA